MSHLQIRRGVSKKLQVGQTDRNLKGGPSCGPASLVRYDGINFFLECYAWARCVKYQKYTRLSCVMTIERLHKACMDL